MHKLLRVGLLIDNWNVPRWVASITADIMASDSATIAGVIVSRARGNAHRFASKYQPRLNPFNLAQLYLYLDYRRFRPEPDALGKIDLKEQLEGSPVLETEPLFDSPHFCFNEQDRNRLQELDLDVLLVLCSGIPTDQVLSLARYGIWSFLDHELLYTGQAPVGFWEVLKQHPVTTQYLQARLAGSPKPKILHRHYGPTLESISTCRNNMLWKSASFVRRKLDELHRSRSVESLTNGYQPFEDGFPRGAATNLRMLPAIASLSKRYVQTRLNNRRYVDRWVMAYKFTSSEQFLDRDFSSYQWLLPPKDRFWADPFPVQDGDRYFLFFEEFVYVENRAHLCVAAIDQDGFKEEPKIILKPDYHVSYPFIFSWKGDWYLIPETQEADRIDVYKFDSFPYKASYYKTVMENVRAADTTLVEIDGRWWMFVSIAPRSTNNWDELFLFYADSPFGPWTPHPENPIKSDVRCARPAGQLFARQGRYYRPAQDCSRGYGYAIRIQEIKTLSEVNYVEEEAEAILPDWSTDFVGTHTFNTAGALTVVDGKQRRRR